MKRSLNEEYPVNSVMEITLKQPTDEEPQTVTGLIYCTDDISNTIVLKKSVQNTTLTSDIYVLNANAIKEKKIVVKEAPKENNNSEGEGGGSSTAANNDTNDGIVELAMPLLNVSREQIEKREKRAIMLAEESFKHINEKVCFCVL